MTAGSACSNGSAFIFVTTSDARRTVSVMFRIRKRRRTRSTFAHVVKPQPEDSDHNCRAVSVYGNDNTPSPILTIPKSIIPSRLWPPVPLSASVPRPEVCVLGAVDELQVNVVLWFLESSGSLPLPAVLTAPIRLDVVQQVHSTQMLDQGPRDGC
jgi:hypothetical protein